MGAAMSWGRQREAHRSVELRPLKLVPFLQGKLSLEIAHLRSTSYAIIFCRVVCA